MSKQLIYPLFAMVLLTFTVALAMLRSRIQAVKEGKIQIRHFRTFSEGVPTEAMLKTSQHFSNLFELPVLFYAGCLAAMVLQMESRSLLFWAWAFVALRVAHAFIHVGSNKIRPRMYVYLMSWVAVLGLWGLVVVQAAAH